MDRDEYFAAHRGRVMDEHIIAEQLYEIEQAPIRRRAFRRHVADWALVFALIALVVVH
jgi:hypothetical protein